MMTIRIILMILITSIAASCGDIGKCEKTLHSETSVLVDVTDEKLINPTKEELEYFKTYSEKEKFFDIENCGTATVNIAAISAKNSLKQYKETIGIESTDFSGKKLREMKDPSPLYLKIDSSYNEILSTLEESPELQDNTNIAMVVAKSIIRMQNADISRVIVITDGVTYSDNHNFYKSVPKNVDDAFRDMIGEAIYKDLQNAVETGGLDILYFVTLDPPNNINQTQLNEIHAFWRTAFENMGIEVLMIDSLNNL